MKKISYQGQPVTLWSVGNSTFLALPEKGARLMKWTVTRRDGSVCDVLHWPENADFTNVAKIFGGNPILFPFSGRCFDRGEIFFWRDPNGVKRAIPSHGLARQGDFKVTRIDESGFGAQFIPGTEARAAYPYDYEFTVNYRFEALGLTCEFTLLNLGPVPLPWSAGHHFYFTVPWSEGRKRSDYMIRIPAARRLKLDATGQLVTGPMLQSDENLANPALVDTFHTALRSNEVVLRENGRPDSVHVGIGHAEVPLPDETIVTWTHAEDSPFYCVEPWMGPSNAAEHRVGLRFVARGETDKFIVRVHVK